MPQKTLGVSPILLLFIGLSHQSKATLEMDRQLRDRQAPVLRRLCPLLANVAVSQVHQLKQRIIAGKNTFALGYFAHLPVKTFDGVGGVNDAPDIFSAL